MIIGHNKIIEFFQKAEADGNLSHAYAFIGPPSVGKRKVAEEIACKLLKVNAQKLPTHPDYIYVERVADEKTGKLKKEISVSQARELRNRLQHTSWQKGNRVIVINEAELLNSESGNALLKILEEPPAGSVFFLLVENSAELLPTIKSRVQSFYFSLVETGEIISGLVEIGLKREDAELFARRSLGRPGKAIQFIDEEFRLEYEKNLSMFKELIGAPFYKKLQLIEGLFGDKEDGERGRTEWQKTLDTWIAFFRDWLLRKNGGSQFAGEPGLSTKTNFSNSELVGIIDALVGVKRLLKSNAHPRLAIEETLLKF